VTPTKRKRRKTADTSSDGLRTANQPKQQRIVLETLRALGPMTRHELAAVTHLPLSSVCGRVSELMKAGSVKVQIDAGKLVRRDGRYVLEATYHTMARAG
jgi:DNA-binding transcriptional regulator LsrR (DeoR family)